jgi:hypothetical protein
MGSSRTPLPPPAEGRSARGHMSMIERGYSNPTWATVKAVSAALSVSMVDLATRVERLET